MRIMKKFLYQNVMQILILVLLSVIGTIFMYYARKLEACETRSIQLETETTLLEEKLEGNRDRLALMRESLERRIDKLEEHLSEKMDMQYSHLQELIRGGAP